MKNKQTESQEQQVLIQWSNLNSKKYPELELLNCSLNGVRLSMFQAVKAKKQGMKKGFPDLFLPVKCYNHTLGSDILFYSGLFIEMKIEKLVETKTKGIVKRKSKQSCEQIWWFDKLKEQGFKCVVCYSAYEAIKEIKSYLRIDDN